MSKTRWVAVIGFVGLCAVAVDARQRPPAEPTPPDVQQRVYRIGQDGVVAPKLRRDASDDERAAAVSSAGRQFARIIDRLAIASRP